MRVFEPADYYTRSQTKRLFAAVPSAAPPAPTNVVFSASGSYPTPLGQMGWVDLTVIPGEPSGTLQGYELEFQPSVSASRFYCLVPSAGPFHVAQLYTNTEYQVRARAFDYYRSVSDWSPARYFTSPKDRTSPAKPLISVSIMDMGALVKIASFNPEPDFLCFLLERSQSSTFTARTEVARFMASSWYDRTITSDGDYFYRVYALDKAGNISPPSDVVGPVPLVSTQASSQLDVPPAPTDVTVTQGNGYLTVQWTAPSLESHKQIRIWRKTSSGFWIALTQIASIYGSIETYVDTDIVPDETYYYSVQAINAYGLESELDTIGVSVGSQFGLMLDPVISSVLGTENDVTLTWTYPANSRLEPFEPIRFDLYRQPLAQGVNTPDNTKWEVITQHYSDTTYRDTGLQPVTVAGVRYLYKLVCIDKFQRSRTVYSSQISIADSDPAPPNVSIGSITVTLLSPDIDNKQKAQIQAVITPPGTPGRLNAVEIYRARPSAVPESMGRFPKPASGTWTISFIDEVPASQETHRLYAVSCSETKTNVLSLVTDVVPSPNSTYNVGGPVLGGLISDVSGVSASVAYQAIEEVVRAVITVNYTAPNPLGTGAQAFEGVEVAIEAGTILETLDWKVYSGSAGGAGSFTLIRPLPASNQSWTIYLSPKNKTRTNPLNKTTTPKATLSVSANPFPAGAPDIRSFQVGTYDPNTASFTSANGYYDTKDQGIKFDCKVQLPVDLTNWYAVEIWGKNASNQWFQLTTPLLKKDFPNSDTDANSILIKNITVLTEYFGTVSTGSTATWTIYAVSVDRNNNRNRSGATVTGPSSSITFSLLPAAPNVSSFSAQAVYDVSEAGDQVFRLSGSWTEPVDKTYFSGIELVLRASDYPTTPDRVLGVYFKGTTSFTVNSIPVLSSQSLTLYARSIDANGRRKTIDGSTPNQALTVGPQVGGSGQEYAPYVTSFTAYVELLWDEAGDQRYRIVGSFVEPSDKSKYRGCRIIAKTAGNQYIPVADISLGSTTFQSTDKPVPFTSEALILYALSLDANNRANTIQVATPKVNLTINKDTSGIPVVTSYNAFVDYSTSPDGIETYRFRGSWALPVDRTVFRGVKVYSATNTADESTWVQLAYEAEDSTTFKTDYWPVPVVSTTYYIFAISVDANNRENAFQAGTTPSVSRVVQAQTTGSIKANRLDPATVGPGLTFSNGQLRPTWDDASNLAVNASFEHDLQGWTVDQWTNAINTNQTYIQSGVKSLQVNISSYQNWASVYNTDFLPCKPGENFYLEAAIYQTGASAGVTGCLVFWAADQVTVTGYLWTPVVFTNNTWGKLTTGIVAAPANSRYVRIYPVLSNNTSNAIGGTIYIDSVVCIRVPEAIFSIGDFQIANGKIELKGIDLTKATNFDSSAFEVSSGALRLKDVAAEKIKTGVLSVGGGGNKVSRFAVFDVSNNPIGWIGDDSGSSGYVGAWFKQILIGGTSPAGWRIASDASGNVAIQDSTFVLTKSSVTITISDNLDSNSSQAQGVKVQNGNLKSIHHYQGFAVYNENYSPRLGGYFLHFEWGLSEYLGGRLKGYASGGYSGLVLTGAYSRVVFESLYSYIEFDGGGSSIQFLGSSNYISLGTSSYITIGASGYINISSGGYVNAGEYRVGSTKVVGSRRTGWTMPTGFLDRNGYNTSSVTLSVLAEHVAALFYDLQAHGLIG